MIIIHRNPPATSGLPTREVCTHWCTGNYQPVVSCAIHCRSNGAASAAGYWWADLPPVIVHTLPQAFVFSTPFYTMAGLHNTFGMN
jgi:hypothetical protein